ncbi:Ankyrin repeat, SAM and basic leucine zipper domain-containing protein 1-like Protein [Tribolium castaneum]|uniref:Ankyrin repeat, SAM and basic leucine zipper domain-containing protein 1-like Protein n=1 Tax=Tribolium castaneum TaxID=7070 RepID=D6WAG4_TRICA|nr:Ankyrin repeat, SAM and basic leucine zipper domain-containing protein 1-like Protein [Tribolium castaneum]
MLCGPDFLSSSDEDGFSDDNDYYDFKERLKASQRQANLKVETEAEREKQHLKSVFSAIAYEKEDVFLAELEKGLDPNVDLDQGWTPLVLACTVANEKFISALVEKNVNVNQPRDGLTPLMLLCNINSKDDVTEAKILSCVKLLLNKGADVNMIDNKRRTAIMFAAYNGHLETVKLLLPLVDKEVEDNQRWNVLFWAVEGSNVKIVEYLLKEGFNCDKTDIRGNTVAELAHSRGFQDILDLFPKDPFDEFYQYLNNNELNFEQTFNNLAPSEKPQFFTDICEILYGTRSESVMPLLRDRNTSLFEFLTLNDSKLKEIGVRFPFQRNRILGGLYKFHKHQFQPKSIPFVMKNQLYTNIDVAAAVLTCVKQTIAMEASLKFILNNCETSLEPKEIRVLLQRNRQQIRRLRQVTDALVTKTEQVGFLFVYFILLVYFSGIRA